MLVDVFPVLDETITQASPKVRSAVGQLGNAFQHHHREVEAREFVPHAHIKRRRCRAFFLVPAHVHVVVIVAAICETVNEPRIAVKGKDDRQTVREQRVEIGIG